MGILDALRGGTVRDATDDDAAAVEQEVGQLRRQAAFVNERLAELEFALEDAEWTQVGGGTDDDFSRQGLRLIVRRSRLLAVKNPLVKRQVRVVTHYVWGQGVEVEARNDAVDAIIRDFMDHPGNVRAMFSHDARTALDRDLTVDGNVFVIAFTPRVGTVEVRPVVVDEIDEVVYNPDDATQPWFYLRTYTRRTVTHAGTRDVKVKVAHPDLDYTPNTRPTLTIGDGYTVAWDQPMAHLHLDKFTRTGQFGIPDTYAGSDWATAHTRMLEDWSSLVASLSQFAWKFTGSGRQTAAAKTRLATSLDTDGGYDTNPPAVPGSVAFTPTGTDLTPIPKTGATTSVDDAKALRLMVGAGGGLPDTILSGDPDQGNLATAKTLDRPTELMMVDRQLRWSGLWDRLFRHVIRHAAGTGRLAGVKVGRVGAVTFAAGTDDVDVTVDVRWPSVLERDLGEVIEAIVMAVTLDGNADAGTLPSEVVTRMLLVALGEDDVGLLRDDLDDEQAGTFTRDQLARAQAAADLGMPLDLIATSILGMDEADAAALAAASSAASAVIGQLAVDAFRAGSDPAALLSRESIVDAVAADDDWQRRVAALEARARQRSRARMVRDPDTRLITAVEEVFTDDPDDDGGSA